MRQIIKQFVIVLGLFVFAGISLGQTNQTTISTNALLSLNDVDVHDAVRAEYKRILLRYNLTITDRPLNQGKTKATPWPIKDISEDALLSFFSSIDIFPVSFMQRTGLKNVVFCKELTLNGRLAGGIASGNTIYFSSTSSKTIYHELFHIIDPSRRSANWTYLNHPKFMYMGSQFQSTGVSQSQIAKTAAEDVAHDFVSAYAMSFEQEDRAETFAYMLANPKQFAQMVEASAVLAKKSKEMKRIVKNVSFDMTDEFWEFVAQSDEETRRNALIERAKINALRLREKKVPIRGGFEREKK